MRRLTILLVASMATLSSPARAKDEYGTAAEAKALVAKAIKHMEAVGTEKAVKDFSDKSAGFVDRDLYVVVYTMEGRLLCHAHNPKMIGKDNLDMRDADGKEYVRERIETSKVRSGFWQEYKWTDPVTRKLLLKAMYTERYRDLLVSVGIYKR